MADSLKQRYVRRSGGSQVASSYVSTTVGEVAEIFDGPHATPAKTAEGPIFLGISCLSGGRLDLGAAEHLSEEDFRRWTRRVTPRPGDVVFSYETRLGEAALIPEGLRCCLGRRMGLLRARNARVDPRFLLYAFLGPEFQEVIRQRTVHGSTVERILLEEMPGFPIRLPPVAEQRAIAGVLGNLDDKIELNRRTNETLEAMARALFKSWFVDFDPVRAKADGRAPVGMDAATATLFPHGLVEGLPAGWRCLTMGEVCSRIATGPFGSSIKAENFVAEGVPVIRGQNLANGFVDEGFVFLRDQKADDLQNANVGPGDLVFTHRGTLGQVGIIPRQARYPRYVVSQSQMLARVNEEVYSRFAAYFHFRAGGGMSDLLAATATTGVPAIAQPTTTLKAIRVVVPPAGVLRAFDAAVQPLLDRAVGAGQESRMLAEVRDLLLPKLLSGELRVRDAEKVVGQIA